jgi:hypothetical protein
MHPVKFYSVNAGPLQNYNLDSIYEASGIVSGCWLLTADF